MDVLERITTLLNEVTDEVYYVFKPDGIPIDDYLVFRFLVEDDWYSDNTHEMDLYYITINHLTKDQRNIYPVEKKLREVIDADKFTYGLINQGSTYIKDTKEYFTALTFYLLVPVEETTIEEPTVEKPTE